MKLTALVFAALSLAFFQPATYAKGSTGKGKSSSKDSAAPAASGSTNPHIVHVKTYVKKDGTVVQAHDQTAPNHTKADNWSTKGNVNPETGKPGTK